MFDSDLKQTISNRGAAPDDVLEALVALGREARMYPEIFAPNARYDVYSAMEAALGPWTPQNRVAGMLETLRVVGAMESGFNWEEGADPDGVGEEKIECRETGMFQVSGNSMSFDPSLPACVDRYLGAHDYRTFLAGMKTNHALAVEYAARVLRFSIRWDGPIERGVVQRYVTRAAMAAFWMLV